MGLLVVEMGLSADVVDPQGLGVRFFILPGLIFNGGVLLEGGGLLFEEGTR